MKLALLFLLLSLASWAEPLSYSGFLACEGRGWQVLHNQSDYEEFVARIPARQLSKRQPAPPSQDPLLEKPPFDFGQVALLAIWSHSVHVEAKILSARKVGEDLEVDLAFGAPVGYEAFAAPHGFGQYHLLQVEPFQGELRVRSIQKKAPSSTR